MEDNKKENVAVVSFLKKLKHDLLRYVIVFVVALVGSILVILPVPRYYKCDISLAPEMDNTENGGKLSSIASSLVWILAMLLLPMPCNQVFIQT